jgi:hypothetical protein
MSVLPAGTTNVWLPIGGEARVRRIADRLSSAGYEVTAERPASDRVVVVASSLESARWTNQLRAGDVVILIDRGPEARTSVDAIRRAGAQAVTPPIGAIVAARAQELITLSMKLPALLASTAEAPWVDPLLAPGSDQAVVDVGLSTIVDGGTHRRSDLVTKVATARARELAKGTGRP